MSLHYKKVRKIPRKKENEWNIVDGSKIYIAKFDGVYFYVVNISNNDKWKFTGHRDLSGKEIISKLVDGNIDAHP